MNVMVKALSYFCALKCHCYAKRLIQYLLYYCDMNKYHFVTELLRIGQFTVAQ